MSKKNSLNTLWQVQLEDWKASGLSQSAWCKKNGISPKRFWYWKKKLLPTPLQQSTVKVKESSSSFVPVTIVPEPSPADDLSLSLPDGLTITGITRDNMEIAAMLAGRLR